MYKSSFHLDVSFSYISLFFFSLMNTRSTEQRLYLHVSLSISLSPSPVCLCCGCNLLFFPCSSWLMAQSVLEKIQPLTPVQSELSSSLSLQRENEIEKETAELTEGLHTLLFCGHDNLFMLYALPALSRSPSLSLSVF